MNRPAEIIPAPPRASIVVPLYNEEDNVVPLHEAITQALEGTGIDYEVVLVDDGSRDETFARAEALVAGDPRVRVVKFRRNYGQTAAMAAGIRFARGEVIVTMDGDLQNDPADIPMLLSRIDEGYDLAIGWRRKRKDGSARVFVSRVANRIMARIMGVAVKDSGCSLKAYRAPLIQNIPMYGEMHRFIPALSQLAGARIAEMEVNHRPRQFGVSKYGFSRIYKVMLDIISIRALLSFAARPATWHIRLVVLFFLLGAAFIALALLDSGNTTVVEGGVGILFLSTSLFLIAWGLIGHLFALVDRDMAEFASLGTTLAEHLQRSEQG